MIILDVICLGENLDEQVLYDLVYRTLTTSLDILSFKKQEVPRKGRWCFRRIDTVESYKSVEIRKYI